MDKETLSNYGWIVICVLVLAVMIALAGPFGNFVADAVKSTTAGLFGVNQNALGAAGITIDGQGFDTTTNGGDPALNPGGVTIENNTYEYGDYVYTRVVVSGNVFGASTLDEAWEIVHAELAAEGITWQDLVNEYSSYGYTEEQLKAELGLTQETFEPTVLGNGWKVAINEKIKDREQTSYGPILESINGIAVTDMTDTFNNCINLATAPAIPNSITNMEYAFSNCTSLVTAPTIPSGVTNLTRAFYCCSSLTSVVIPNGVTEIGDAAFYECSSLSTVDFPNTLTKIGKHAFTRTNIETVTLPSNLIELGQSAFVDCKSIKIVNLNNKLQTIGIAAFEGCSNLESITIPNSVTTIGAVAFNVGRIPVIFENINGWSVTNRWDETKTYTINASDLADVDTASNLLTNNSAYMSYHWTRTN